MLSIIIIAYNEEKFIPALLSSLSRQTSKNFEIIIADSNSSDKTKKVSCLFEDQFKFFTYLKLSHTKGPAYGRNMGEKKARFERLLFLDSDTILQDDFIENSIKEIKRKNIDIATCPIKIRENNFFSDAGASFLNFFMFFLRPLYPTAFGACLFSTKTIQKKIGGFNENLGFCEDCHYVKKALSLNDIRFKTLKTFFYTSNRRAEKEGIFKLTSKYLKAHLYRIFTGREIIKGKINYNYGEFQ